MSTEPRVCLISLGCPKNQVDSETLLAHLEAEGFTLEHDPQRAEILVINTCAFIEDAQRESIEEILRAAARKTAGTHRFVVAVGCLAERHGRALLREIPELDALVGPGQLSRLASTLRALLAGETGRVHIGEFESPGRLAARVRIGSPQSAYVKIAEGCRHRCSFCLIPRLRGPLRSRDPGDVVREVEELAAEGVREVVLVAQDSTSYGRDLGAGVNLSQLLRRLADCAGPDWIRVLYTYPDGWSDSLITVFAEGGPLVPYVDVPIQHVADGVLAAMGRGRGGVRIRRLVERLRSRIPGVILRTTVMTGHPGEGPREFAELLMFLQEFPFDRLGAFAYSPEDGTRSASLRGANSRAEAELRRDEVLALQRDIARTLQVRRKGTETDVLVEGVQPQKGFAVGRSYGEAPEIDGVVYLKAVPRPPRGQVPEPGDLVAARIVGAGAYDLVAVPRGSLPADTARPHAGASGGAWEGGL